ncbi:hypothetical protein MMC26_001702 [Xylographa opegraphella]|nr:hypothetical protein [Xylographa opegraphella]
MAKPSLVGIKRPRVEELLREPQLDADTVSDEDTDLADSDVEQQSIEFGDSPSEQLRRETIINAPMSTEHLTAVAVKAQRMLDAPEDVDDKVLQLSAMILNSALDEHSRNASGQLAPAIVLQPTGTATKKRMLASDALQSPSKRLRGRPPKAVAVERPIRRLTPPASGNGRLKRPTQRPTRNNGGIPKARTAEEIYDVPEDSPLKPTKSTLSLHGNNNAVQESREDTADDRRRSMVVKPTSEPQEANNKTLVLPRKRGRPPKGNMKISSHNEKKKLSASIDAHASRSGSSLEHSDLPEKVANIMVKAKRLPNTRVPGKTKPQIEECSMPSRSSSITSGAGRISLESVKASVRASEISTETNTPPSKVAEGSRTEDYEESSSDDDASSIESMGKDPGETEEIFVAQSDRLELQEGVTSIQGEGETLHDRDVQPVDPRLETEARGAAMALEIFSADEKFKRVLQAARSVGLKKGRSVSGERRVDHKISLLSAAIKRFLEKVKKVSLCCQQANSIEYTNTESQHNLRSRLRDYSLWLELAIEEIRSSNDATRNVGRIQDIYVHAIPQMVFLLKNTLNAQSRLYSAGEEIESLKHVLGVQGLVINLCEKVKSFSESADKKGQTLPIKKLPIKGATSRKILPYLRNIGDTIETELSEMRDEKRRVADERALLKSYQAREARLQTKREKNQMERERKQRQAADDVLRLSGGHVVDKFIRQHRQNPLELDQWTETQDRELLRLLWNLEDLPAERRYLITLNSPLLQNKLPEHIRRRALILKPAIESNFVLSGLRIPEWVSSLV